MKNKPIDPCGIPVAITALLGIAYMAFVIATAPDISEEPEDSIGGNICIEDEIPFYQDPYPPEFYATLYPADEPGVMRDKNGEVITMDPLPDPAGTDLATITPDGSTGYPALRWVEQSMTGQSPPVLYWPAPAYKQTLKKPGKPCANRYKPVPEPGMLAIIGAALLAAGVMR